MNTAEIENKAIRSCIFGDIITLTLCINSGFNVSTHNDICVCYASEYGFLDIVRYLKSLGANIGTRNNYPLINACRNGHFHIVQYLVCNGVDIHHPNNVPIQTASKLGNNLNIVKYLSYKGASLEGISKDHLKILSVYKIIDFYKRQKLRKHILTIWKQIVPIYYHPRAKGGFFLKRNALIEIESIVNSIKHNPQNHTNSLDI